MSGHTCDSATHELSSFTESSTSSRFGLFFVFRMAVDKSSALIIVMWRSKRDRETHVTLSVRQVVGQGMRNLRLWLLSRHIRSVTARVRREVMGQDTSRGSSDGAKGEMVVEWIFMSSHDDE